MANPKGNPQYLTAPRFKKGQSGNPGGKPKKRPITDEYANLADQPLPEKLRQQLQTKLGVKLAPGTTFSQSVAIRRYLEAMGYKMETGGTKAAKEIRESMEGKAPQRIEITQAPKTEIRIRVKFDRSKKVPSE